MVILFVTKGSPDICHKKVFFVFLKKVNKINWRYYMKDMCQKNLLQCFPRDGSVLAGTILQRTKYRGLSWCSSIMKEKAWRIKVTVFVESSHITEIKRIFMLIFGFLVSFRYKLGSFRQVQS